MTCVTVTAIFSPNPFTLPIYIRYWCVFVLCSLVVLLPSLLQLLHSRIALPYLSERREDEGLLSGRVEYLGDAQRQIPGTLTEASHLRRLLLLLLLLH